MEHVIQINSEIYTIVVENWEQALKDRPDLFKKVNCEIPENYQSLIYNNDNEYTTT